MQNAFWKFLRKYHANEDWEEEKESSFQPNEIKNSDWIF